MAVGGAGVTAPTTLPRGQRTGKVGENGQSSFQVSKDLGGSDRRFLPGSVTHSTGLRDR